MIDYSKLFEKIGLNQEGVKLFFDINTRIKNEEFRNQVILGYDAFLAGNEAFEKFVRAFAEKENLDAEQMHLYLTVIYSEGAYNKMKERGIEDEHFYNSFKDVARNCAIVTEKTGKAGLEMFELPWFKYSLDANLYLLGRLQFQVAKSEYDITEDGFEIKKGDTVLFVHVPGTAPLTEEACNSSYKSALDFFGKYYGMSALPCFCYSWLLQPWLGEVLPEKTNIMKFKSTYKLIETIQSIPHTFRFIFDEQCDDPKLYPTDNPLRKLAVERLVRGDFIGYGVGVRIVTDKSF